jgi:penicillin-binding protein 1C
VKTFYDVFVARFCAVIPAKAGTQTESTTIEEGSCATRALRAWVPAFAGMTVSFATVLASTIVVAIPPAFDSVRAQHTPSDRYLLDRHGEPLQRIRVNDKVRRGEWVKLDDVSPAMIDAVLASEDKRFFEHGGVDWRAAASAAITNLRAGEVKRGASSISMQVAAGFDANLARANAGKDTRTFAQKFDQAQAAWDLERTWSKPQILETYLNTIYFRGELQGIGAASEQLFGKAAHGLNRIESSILAALVRSPQAPRTQIERRACEVLRSMENDADCGAIAYAIDRWGAVRTLRNDEASIAPHVVKYVHGSTDSPRTGSGGRQIDPFVVSPSNHNGSDRQQTTLDRPLQLAAHDAIRKHLQILQGRNAHDTAVVVIDNASGEVLAYVGSSAQLSEAGEVDAARAPRQAGSTLKPFIYGLGIEKNLFTAATLLDDSPFSVDVGGGAYTPQNYAHEYVGPVSVRTALASSLNVPAIRALTLVGVAPTHALLKRAGLTTLVNDPDHYGFSLALGSADVNLLELTNAYRAIANGGVWSETRFALCTTCRNGSAAKLPPLQGDNDKLVAVRSGGGDGVRTHDANRGIAAPTGRRIFSENTSWLLANILSDRGARYVTFGFDNPLALSHWAAVKTGTSKDMRDNWTIGFNTRVTVGVWVGNAKGLPMHNVSGVSGAGPIWADVMEAAAQRYGANAPPKAPSSLVKRRIEFTSEHARIEPGRDEWFVRGSEPANTGARIAVAAREANSQGARIVSPTDGTIIAIDPDIPEANQRIALKSGDANEAGCWEINGESLGCSANAVMWSHARFAQDAKNALQNSVQIRLLDRDNKERDRVTITLRTSQKTQQTAVRSRDK